MRISILEIIGDSSLGGAPRHLLSIAENLDAKKFDLHLICPPGPLAGEVRKLSRQIDLDLVAMNSRWDLKAVGKIRRKIKRIAPAIIHIHGTRAGALGRLAAAGLNISVIYTEHLWTKNFQIGNRFLRHLHLIGYWFLDMFTTLNIAVSEAVKEFMVQSGISRYEKIKVIYNGIEPTKHQAKIFTSEKEFLIATVATLNKNKGIQYLLRALPQVKAEFPGVRLEIIGDGAYKRALQKEVKKLKLKDYVKFTGFAPDVKKYLTKFDLYVQPSLSESFGLAMAQAMNVGLPVVASAVGGMTEVVTDGKSGLLVEPANSKALAAAILALLRQPAKARRMGKAARQEAQTRFNLKDMIGELETVYEETAASSAFAS